MSPITDKKPARAFIWVVLLATTFLIMLSWYARAQPSAALPSSTSETQATLGYGQIVLQLDNPSGFQQGQTVQITSTTDQQTAVGTIVTWDPILFNATINITTPNLQGNVYFSFFVQVLASAGNQVGIHPDLTAVSNTPYNGAPTGAVTPGTPSSLKMTVSLPGSLVRGAIGGPVLSPTLTAGNIYPFTVASGLVFPPQSHVQIDDLTPGAHDHYSSYVYSYIGTTLNLFILSVVGSGTPSTAWGLYGVAGPETRVAPFQQTGLQVVSIASNLTICITAGSVRDTLDQIDLVAPNFTCFASGTGVVLGGTVSISGTTVTGTGTHFTTDFSAAATLTDINNQLTAFHQNTVSFPSIFREDGNFRYAATTAIASDTSMTIGNTLGAFPGPNYERFPPSHSGQINSGTMYFGLTISYVSDGSTILSSTSFTKSGLPDLPPNTSNYRVFGYVGGHFDGSGNWITTSLVQPMLLGLNSCGLVSQLPAGMVGMRNCVTDGTSCAFGSGVSGGGSTFCPVIYNGTSWQAG